MCGCSVGKCSRGGQGASGVASGMLLRHGLRSCSLLFCESSFANLPLVAGYKSQKSSCLHLSSAEITSTHHVWIFTWLLRNELRFSCLLGKNFTDWAILKIIIFIDFGSAADLIKFDAQSYFNVFGIYSNKCDF